MSGNEHELDRRRFLRQGLSGLGAAAAAGAQASSAPGQAQSSKPIRIGLIGLGSRGRSHLRNLLATYPEVTVPAICDIQEDRLAMASEMVTKARGATPVGYSKGQFAYRKLCERGDLDAVLISTPVYWLGRMTVDALRAGKHAALEVSGAQTEEECWDMVREKNKSGKHVMFLENCCYGNDTLTIYCMVKQGVFGEPYYAEGSYVHDCRSMFFDSSGKLTWRGELYRDSYGNPYPQHGLGSNCKWLEINDGDRMESCQTMMSSPRAAHLHAVAQFGSGSEPAKVRFQTGDFVSTLIQTAKGRMIRVDYSLSCTRPYSRYYLLQGTKGCWDSRSGIFLDQVSPGRSGSREGWEALETYRQKYQHPYWREAGVAAQRAGGHGGIDYYCLYDFMKMLREDKEPWIDVYDAAAWSAIIFCSKLSLDRKGARVEMPDFTEGKWRDPNWRKDRMPIS